MNEEQKAGEQYEDEFDDPNGDPEYREALIALHYKVGTIIRDHLAPRPESPPRRDKVFQALNVLAMETATILVACDDLLAAKFFMESLEGNIQHIRDNREEIAKRGTNG